MAITIVGTGAVGEHANGTPTIALPTGWKPGDSLYVWFFSRISGTPVPRSDWTELMLVSGTTRRLAVYYKRATAGEQPFTITAGAGVCAGAMTAFRSTRDGYEVLLETCNNAAYFGTGVQDIGAVSKPTPVGSMPAVGAAVFLGAKIGAWTSVATLSGDSLTWTELVDYPTTTGNDMGLVVDVATWTSAPTLSSKTFTVTGGSTADAVAKSIMLSEVAVPRTNRRPLCRPLALALSRPVSRPLAA